MIGWEALLIGLVASTVGLIPGAALAKALGSALSSRGIAPEDLEVAVGIFPALAAVGCSVLTALIAVAAAGRRAARVEPTLALRESSLEPRMIGPVRLLGGLLSLGASLALLWIATSGGDVNSASDAAAGVSLTLVVAVAFLSPVLARATGRITAAALARSRWMSGVLAASNLGTSPRRFASAMTPLVLTVALSSTMLFLASTRSHAATEQSSERVTADLVLHSDGVGIPRDAVEAARMVPGVATVVGTASTTLGPSLGSNYQAIPAEVLDSQDITRVLDLGVVEGSVENLHDDAIALSETRAEVADVEVGDIISIALGDGTPREVRVAAVYSRSMGFGEVVLSSALADGHRTSPMLDSVLIRLEPGAHQDEVAAQLRTLSESYPGLTVGDRHDLAVRVDTNRQTNEWLFNILVAIVFLFTAVAVVNTLTMIAVHRRRELALLQLIGATPRQVRAMARWEAGLLVILGLGLGAAISMITLMPTSALLTGSSIPHAPVGLVALVFGSAAAVGFVGSQLATRLAMRARPVDAIGVRD
jgi:putative ABC transport system permease protein